MARVIVGMSGGVDSAVAAYLLKQAGYDVIGVTLRTWEGADGQESRCCEIDDARETARKIGIPYHAFNCISDFRNKVIEPFIQDYLHGLTPNPCVVCNRAIKWERLLYHADVLEADYIANASENGYGAASVEAFLSRVVRTGAGARLLRSVCLPEKRGVLETFCLKI